MKAESTLARYTVELLPNIQLLDLTIFNRQDSTITHFNGSVTLNATNASATIAVSPDNETSLHPQTLTFPLPKGSIDLACMSQQSMSDHIHIKIPWQAKVTTTSSATELSLIPASAYLNAIELLCHECNECIVTTNDEGFARVLDMPSTYWRELADLWICHREEYKIVPEAEALLKPRIRQLLVSTSHLFVHPDQLRMDQLQVDKIQDGNATSWWLPISCRACKAPLGIARLDNDVINEVKLDKWAVTIRNNVSCDNQDYVQPCSFIQYFAIDLVELGKAHAGYRVLIQEQTTKQTRIMIWVLNWSTRLLTNTAQPVMNKQAGDTNDIVEYWEVIKLLYCVIPVNTNDSNTSGQALLSSWQDNKQIEQLVLHSKWCDTLISSLEASSQAWPPTRQVGFPGFTVGFLPLRRAMN